MPLIRQVNGFLRAVRSKPPPTWLVLCGPAVANMCFGLYPVIVKLFAGGETGEKANGYIFTLYRGVGATPVLFLLSYYCEGKILIPDFRDTMVLLLLGLCGVFIGQTAYITGVYTVGPDMSSAMQNLIPIWTTLISIAFCVEKIPPLNMLHTYAKLFGILIAVGGAINIFSGDAPGGVKGQEVLGYSALMLDTICGGVLYTMQKKLIFDRKDCVWKDYPVATTAYTYLFGCILQAIANLYFVFTGQAHLFLIPRHSLPALVYAIFITSTFCYSIVSWANKYLPSSVMTAFWPVQTLVAVVSAYMILGLELTVKQCIGVVFIITGLCLVIYSNHVDERLTKKASDGTESVGKS